MPIGRPPLPLTVRFWRRVDKNGPVPHAGHLGNCWLWTLQPDRGGYGLLREGGRNARAHRISWELHYGEVPEGLMVCHRCDNRLCVRPTHLFLGTAQDNIRDRDEKGRTARGDRSGARLHPETHPRGDEHHFRRNPSLILRGEAHPRRLHPERWSSGKLTMEDAQQIRGRVGMGETQAALAKEFGVSGSTVSYIISGRFWQVY